MADTHINAFFADVEEAKKKVDLAQGELNTAQARLEEKKRELGLAEAPAEEKPKAVNPAATVFKKK